MRVVNLEYMYRYVDLGTQLVGTTIISKDMEPLASEWRALANEAKSGGSRTRDGGERLKIRIYVMAVDKLGIFEDGAQGSDQTQSTERGMKRRKEDESHVQEMSE
ncbi:unnamed protein product [Gordionus sp. m RMFG-2023]